MKKRVAGAIIGLGLLALPATSFGDKDSSSAPKRGGKGGVVAKDSAKDNPAAAVAQVTLNGDQIGKVSYRITANPSRTKVDWGITTRCVKGFLIDYFPGPGQFKTRTKPAGFGGKFSLPLADPDFCTFAVAGQTFKNDAGKRVTVKIFNKK